MGVGDHAEREVGCSGGVEGDGDDAALEAAEESGHPLQAVLTPEDDALAHGNFAADEFCGEAVGEGGEVSPRCGDLAVAAMNDEGARPAVAAEIVEEGGEIRAHIRLGLTYRTRDGSAGVHADTFGSERSQISSGGLGGTDLETNAFCFLKVGDDKEEIFGMRISRGTEHADETFNGNFGGVRESGIAAGGLDEIAQHGFADVDFSGEQAIDGLAQHGSAEGLTSLHSRDDGFAEVSGEWHGFIVSSSYIPSSMRLPG